ncbi:MAG: hypothetical protein AAF682_28000 [Planctomycetota bacterium]
MSRLHYGLWPFLIYLAACASPPRSTNVGVVVDLSDSGAALPSALADELEVGLVDALQEQSRGATASRVGARRVIPANAEVDVEWSDGAVERAGWDTRRTIGTCLTQALVFFGHWIDDARYDAGHVAKVRIRALSHYTAVEGHVVEFEIRAADEEQLLSFVDRCGGVLSSWGWLRWMTSVVVPQPLYVGALADDHTTLEASRNDFLDRVAREIVLRLDGGLGRIRVEARQVGDMRVIEVESPWPIERYSVSDPAQGKEPLGDKEYEEVERIGGRLELRVPLARGAVRLDLQCNSEGTSYVFGADRP